MRRLLPTIVLGALLVATACSSAGAPTWTYPPAAAASPEAPAASTAPSSAPASPGAPTAVAGTLTIDAFDLGFTPKDLTVDAPGRYEIKLTNTGAVIHDLTFPDGATTGPVAGGATGSVEVDVPEAGIAFICSVPGHAAAGMTGTISVKGAAAAGGDDHGGPAPSGDVAADPNAPAPVTYDATAPERLPEGEVHDIDLVITEIGDDRRQGLRAGGLDVRRHRARPGHPGHRRRQDPRPPEEPGHQQAAPLHRLPRQPGRLE